MFTREFDQYVLDGDEIRCEVEGFECVARIMNDDSINIHEYECYSEEDIARWNKDEWHFVGVCVTVGVDGVQLESNALWGLEANLTTDHSYLREVANELLPDAIKAARATLARINEIVEQRRSA